MRIRDWDSNLKVRLFGEAMMNITFWMFFPFLTIYFAEEFGKNKAGLLLVFSQVFSVIANLNGWILCRSFWAKTDDGSFCHRARTFFFSLCHRKFTMASIPLDGLCFVCDCRCVRFLLLACEPSDGSRCRGRKGSKQCICYFLYVH